MCFVSRKRFKKLEADLAHLVDTVEGERVKKLTADSEKLTKTEELLSHIKFKVKSVQVVENQQTGRQSVIIQYELPKIILDIDENGKPNKNDFFYSSNILNMISLTDMKTIQDAIEKAQKIK